MRSGMGRVARGLGRWLRDAWLIAGLTLAVFLALEAGYRGVRALRRAAEAPAAERATAPPVPHPNASLAWWSEYHDYVDQERRRYDPYRLFWALALHARHVNVDSLGRRVTPQPTPVPPARRVLMLGGSTMWGVSLRDSFTIPAGVTRRLRSAGGADLAVENLAQPSYRTTQEAATLLVELARGPRPAAVVVLNGYNDAALALRLGEVGRVNGEEVLRQRVALGRRGFAGELVGLGRHAAVIQRLQRLVVPGEPGPPPAAARSADICLANAEYYRRIARAMSGIGAGLGFPVFFFLQPMHFLTGKPLTVWEAALEGRASSAADLRRCMLAIDSVMAAEPDVRYRSLHRVFDADTASVFVDAHGHLTEAASDRVSACIAAVVAPTLIDRPRPAAGAADPCGGPVPVRHRPAP